MQYDDHATHQGGGDSLLCPAHCVCVTVSHSHVISDHQEGRPSTVWGVDTTATNPVYRLGLLSVSVSSCRGEGAAVLPAMPSTDTNTVTTLACRHCRHCRHCRLSSCRAIIIPVSPLAWVLWGDTAGELERVGRPARPGPPTPHSQGQLTTSPQQYIQGSFSCQDTNSQHSQHSLEKFALPLPPPPSPHPAGLTRISEPEWECPHNFRKCRA